MIVRTSVTLDSIDVDLLDRLAKTQGLNRSQQLRQFLAEARPMLRQAVETLEAAMRTRDDFLVHIASTHGEALDAVMVEIEKVQNVALGSLARLEGAMTAQESKGLDADERLIQAFGNAQGIEVPPRSDPQAGNNGGHKSNRKVKGN
jgi:Ribbon-helix-helix protein, copG family